MEWECTNLGEAGIHEEGDLSYNQCAECPRLGFGAIEVSKSCHNRLPSELVEMARPRTYDTISVPQQQNSELTQAQVDTAKEVPVINVCWCIDLSEAPPRCRSQYTSQ